MTHDLFCVTYAPDAQWTQYMLRSVQKHCTGFRRLLLLCPRKDLHLFLVVSSPFPFVKVIPVDEPPGKGHAYQNFLKCCCDLYSDADFFHHIDSDCAVIMPWNPSDYFTGGKPDLLYAKYSDCGTPWRNVTENALGFSCPYETMRRFPFVYPRDLYRSMREFIEQRIKRPFEWYALTAPAIKPAFHGFSEFCALGAYAMEKHAANFATYSTANDLKPSPVLQFHSVCSHPSHAGYNKTEADESFAKLETITKGWDAPEPRRIVLAIQYWSGDREASMRNVRRIVDNEPAFRKDFEMCFVSRFDCEHDLETIEYAKSRFRVSVHTSARRGTGWPTGCNDLVGDLLQHSVGQVKNGEWAKVSALFLMEGDCIPIHREWLSRLSDEWSATEREWKWLSGKWHATGGPVGHVNGNMLIHPMIAHFIPSIAGTRANMAWDCAWAPAFKPHWRAGNFIENLYQQTAIPRATLESLSATGKVLIHGVIDLSVEKYADEILRTRSVQ